MCILNVPGQSDSIVDFLFRYYTEKNRTTFIYGGYEGIPENLLLNVIIWAVSIVTLHLVCQDICCVTFGKLPLHVFYAHVFSYFQLSAHLKPGAHAKSTSSTIPTVVINSVCLPCPKIY